VLTQGSFADRRREKKELPLDGIRVHSYGMRTSNPDLLRVTYSKEQLIEIPVRTRPSSVVFHAGWEDKTLRGRSANFEAI